MEFKLVPDDIFEEKCVEAKLATGGADMQGICEICCIQMNYVDATCSYQCTMCGRTEDIIGGKREYKEDKKAINNLRIVSAGPRRYKYAANNDYNRTRQRQLLNALETKNNEYR